MDKPSFASRAKKLLVAVVGLAGSAAAAGVFDDRTETIVVAVVSILTALGVYQVTNKLSASDLAAQAKERTP